MYLNNNFEWKLEFSDILITIVKILVVLCTLISGTCFTLFYFTSLKVLLDIAIVSTAVILVSFIIKLAFKLFELESLF